MTNPRRDFLGWLGASALLSTTASPLSASPAGPEAPRALDSKWDMSWTDKLTGKYRAVFDSPEVSEGAALFRAVIWQDHHAEVYGTDLKTMNSVIVFRHAAISLVMNDAYWANYDVGKSTKLKTPEGKKWAVANPIRSSPADTPPKWAKYNLESFIASGGIVLACNLAFGDVVSAFQDKEKIKVRADARKRALEHLIPGVILQPSGVFGALRAQEAGCHYILAS
jgi:hypothetical protein